MDINTYLDINKEIQALLLRYIECENDEAFYFQSFVDFFTKQKDYQTKTKMKSFLYLFNSISSNHSRNNNFSSKIKQIIQYFEKDIRNFSSLDIYKIFHKNKYVLLILLEANIITIDASIVDDMKTNRESLIFHFDRDIQFFYPEIKQYIDEKDRKNFEYQMLNYDPNIFNDFDEKRRIGENEQYICELIRSDSIVEFVSYVNKTNYPLSNYIKPSIFETNQFLRYNTLIEYAAFYGSIQIFQYLKMNNVQLTSSLWLYAIHSNNPNMIYILEENNVTPKDSSYGEYFQESIKCHHNNIANYIETNYVQKNAEKCIFQYYNYEYFPSNFCSFLNIGYLIEYDYYEIVKAFLSSNKVGCNYKNVNCVRKQQIL